MSETADMRAALLSALEWQIELGADEAIGEAPVDRFAEAAKAPPKPKRRAAPPDRPGAAPTRSAPARGKRDPALDEAVATAEEIAARCATLDELRAAVQAFDGCPLKAGARSCVFSDGNQAARLMIIGEAPGREEDMSGKPFVGKSGQLLDRMLAAIGLSRHAEDPADAAYITNMIPWRPVGNRTPGLDETAMLTPFLRRHVALKAPEFLLLVGGAAVKGVLETETGVMKMRGRWSRPAWAPCPALATLHPAYLLRAPAQKRLAWRDLLALRAALDGDLSAIA